MEGQTRPCLPKGLLPYRLPPRGRARVENSSSGDGSYASALLMFKSRMFCSILGFYPLHGKSLPNTTKLPGIEKQCSRETCWSTAEPLQRASPAYSEILGGGGNKGEGYGCGCHSVPPQQRWFHGWSSPHFGVPQPALNRDFSN